MVTRKILTLVLMLYLSISAMAQQTPEGYNPFVPANLDDPTKLTESPVVESSYHRYWVAGDQVYTDPSTFVWYVENGEFGTYDTISDAWSPLPLPIVWGAGNKAHLIGKTIGASHNSSEVWVKWNNGSAGNTGYIAVYEQSSDSCVVDNQITGFKHTIVAAPEIWMLAGIREECSDQTYAVSVKFNNVYPNSYPYRFTVDHPGNDGLMTTTEFVVGNGDLDASLMYTFDLPAVQDLDVTRDENYTITIESLRDKFGSTGKIAPLGVGNGQYASMTIFINHLPQTGDMTMD